MRSAFAWCILGLLSITGIPISRAEGSSSDVEKAIATLEEKWAEGERTNNVDLIAPLIADGFIVTESDGEIADRAAFLAEEKSSHYSSSTYDELKVRVFGDTAIVSYALSQKYTNKGKAHDVHVRETDTWVKMPSGNWQCVAAHASKIKHA